MQKQTCQSIDILLYTSNRSCTWMDSLSLQAHFPLPTKFGIRVGVGGADCTAGITLAPTSSGQRQFSSPEQFTTGPFTTVPITSKLQQQFISGPSFINAHTTPSSQWSDQSDQHHWPEPPHPLLPAVLPIGPAPLARAPHLIIILRYLMLNCLL